ncbi:hypothetical protein Poli38472_000113 [Pythium oligandrum]|uniref:Uncharacterized protein n=1 Tax=Pythium oligandrum TaxID=41045 RepID=A0A8K1CBU2_PYTOL|nr:hypothetical protein Poli38472_000113 [Pythium oligandrum]|eukprot:TMW60071.1 hypothetical protein Poli38472_000113 [Pythium oligandrum]
MTHLVRRSCSRLVAISTLETAISALSSCLSYEDKLSLLVFAHDQDLDEFARYLEYDDAMSIFPRELVVNVAAAQGCTYALTRLLRMTDGRSYPDLERSLKSYYPSVSTERTRLMRWLNRYRPHLYDDDVMTPACARGDMECVEWLHTTSVYDIETAMCAAAKNGHFAVVQWLVEHQSTALRQRPAPVVPSNDTPLPLIKKKTIKKLPVEKVVVPEVEMSVGLEGKLLYWVVQRGNVRTRWFSSFKDKSATIIQHSTDGEASLTKFGASKMDPLAFAVSLGDVELSKRVYEDEALRPEHTEAVAIAARRGDFDVMRWLCDVCGYEIPAQTAVEATQGGHLSILEWLEDVCGWNLDAESVLNTACVHGHLPIVQWMYVRLPEWKLNVKILETRNEETRPRVREMFEWLYGEGRVVFEWRYGERRVELVDLVSHAAALGSVSVTMQCVENGATEVKNGFSSACAHGELPVVKALLDKWLVQARLDQARPAWQQHARRDREPFIRAVEGGHQDVAEFLLQEVPECCPNATVAALRLVRGGKVEFARKLYNPVLELRDPGWRTYSWDVEDAYCAYSHREQLRHLLRVKKIVDAAEQDRLRDFVEWRYSDYMFSSDEISLTAVWAAQRGDIDLLRALGVRALDEDLGYNDPEEQNRKALDAVMKYTKAGEIVCSILEHSPTLIDEDLVTWAAQFRQIAVLHCIKRILLEDPARAASLGLRRLFQLVTASASQHGHADVLEWVLQAVDPLFAASKAVESKAEANTEKQFDQVEGTTSQVQALNLDFGRDYDNKSPELWRRALRTATTEGHLHVIQWLESHSLYGDGGDREHESFVTMACRHGHTKVVEWLWHRSARASSTQTPSNVWKRGLRSAVAAGHTQLVAWLVEAMASTPSIPNDPQLMEEARGYLGEQGVERRA